MFTFEDIEEMREDIFMVLDDNGIRNKEGHWMTEDELNDLTDDEVVQLYKQIYRED